MHKLENQIAKNVGHLTFEKFKESLGKTGKQMNDDEIQKLMSTFDYLTDYWLDQQEIKIFGSTIKTLLDL